jgi:peptide chain release factor 3
MLTHGQNSSLLTLMIEQDIPSIVASQTSARRTFAIISHPDAGKTTLTEKLLLYSGMIRTAGMVHGRKTRKSTSSDWMALEQERGISITASAMQFRYKFVVINVLDTPGHQDFSEDTYRTLTAADCAVMVIDAAKGVEEQTRKLFSVCRMRNIPILTFINKMDLHGKDPFDLISEVEEVLGIQAYPFNWPIGSGKEFIGVAECATDKIIIFEKVAVGGSKPAEAHYMTLPQARKTGVISDTLDKKLTYELELLKEAGNKFSKEKFLKGSITPVFFGSALTNFGVEPFFDNFQELAPCPGARLAYDKSGKEIYIDPIKQGFSAYVFKIQANIDPKHRDSMAYLRICSGQFERDLLVHHHRLNKKIRLSRSHSMFGGDRNIIDNAYPGDIVGVVNPGTFSIGDTVSVDGNFYFQPIPKFPPEVVSHIRPKDTSKRKAFDKGMKQFHSEGTVLVLESLQSKGDVLVAAVGRLQFEVLQHRLLNEYGVETKIDSLPYNFGAWLVGDPTTFRPTSSSMIAKDKEGRLIFLFTHEWERGYAEEQNPEHKLLDFID